MADVIELHGITKRFGDFFALQDVSLTVAPGVTGLLGPNGAGKSTLIKILLGLLQTSSGSGHILGHDLLRQSRAVRAKVGYMPEDDCYLSALSGVESAQVFARLSRLPRVESLRRAHEILDFCGVGQERYRPVQTYSTGMRQKLKFAQAIVHDPPLLILDEPTSGLDPEERVAMLNRIRTLAKKHDKSIVICTHILPDVQAASDAVVILAEGQVRVSDKLDVLSRPASPSVLVRTVATNHQAFARGLRDAGLTVEIDQENQAMAVRGAEETVVDTIWRVAHETETGIRSLSPARNSLEGSLPRCGQGEAGATRCHCMMWAIVGGMAS